MFTKEQEMGKLTNYLRKNGYDFVAKDTIWIFVFDGTTIAWDVRWNSDGSPDENGPLEVMNGSVKLAKYPTDLAATLGGDAIEGGLTADEIIRRLEVIRDGGCV